MKPQFIVCAAVMSPCDIVVAGPRHFDITMHNMMDLLSPDIDWANSTQGFLDQYGSFHDRIAAYEIAAQNGQLKRRPGGYDGPELFSEDLY